jgi:hypothetical protein
MVCPQLRDLWQASIVDQGWRRELRLWKVFVSSVGFLGNSTEKLYFSETRRTLLWLICGEGSDKPSGKQLGKFDWMG